ncbi:MAG: sterol desaturase family protein [Planctomycetota bacterium]
MDAVADTAWSFAILLAIFLPLELLFPANGRRVLHRGSGTDLLFFLGQYLLWTAPVVAALTWVHRNTAALPLGGLQDAVRALPFALQFALVILLSDLSIYWGHRLSHQVPLLWRFHRVHHTAEKVDWLAAHREHPLDNLYTRLIENLPPILLGFPLPALAGFAMFRGLWALYIHSNVALSPGPLRYLLGAPRLHHWHHAEQLGGGVNFANLSPLMDLLFGTYYDPGHMPTRYGAGDGGPTGGYLRQLAAPLLPRYRARA